MLKPSLQLRLGQQLTMTPQLQQAIRLLQLPALELQQQVREALEQNVMLEAEEDVPEYAPESDATLAEAGVTASDVEPASAAGEAQETGSETTVEIGEEAWDAGAGPANDAPWSGDNDRGQEISDQHGATLHEHLAWQLELARLDPRELAIGRAIVDAINDDGYLIDSLEDIRQVLRPELEVSNAEVEAILKHVHA